MTQPAKPLGLGASYRAMAGFDAVRAWGYSHKRRNRVLVTQMPKSGELAGILDVHRPDPRFAHGRRQKRGGLFSRSGSFKRVLPPFSLSRLKGEQLILGAQVDGIADDRGCREDR